MLPGRDKKSASEVKEAFCEECGAYITYTGNKPKRFCEACTKKRKQIRGYEQRQQKKNRKLIARRAENIAHQQDTSVWTRDYAERQKQKTLEMIGKIEINKDEL